MFENFTSVDLESTRGQRGDSDKSALLDYFTTYFLVSINNLLTIFLDLKLYRKILIRIYGQEKILLKVHYCFCLPQLVIGRLFNISQLIKVCIATSCRSL